MIHYSNQDKWNVYHITNDIKKKKKLYFWQKTKRARADLPRDSILIEFYFSIEKK